VDLKKIWDSVFLNGTETYELPDREVRFVKTEKNGPKYDGKIKIPKYVFEFPKNEIDSVFYHEIAHSRPIGIVFYLVLIYLLVKCFLLILIGLYPLVANFFGLMVWNLLLFFKLFAQMVIIKWIYEIYCDLYSVYKTKSDAIGSALQMLPKINNVVVRLFEIWINHPPPLVRLWFIKSMYRLII
jgi:hypothetical protein